MAWIATSQALLAMTIGFCALPTGAASASPQTVHSAYLTGCGGCHGIEGRSYAPRVPDLAAQAGFFLCTPAGRAYLGRLPNVAYAHLDSGRLADVLNYVAFTLGGGSAPAEAAPYTEAEVARLRTQAIDDPALLHLRSGIVAGVLQRCPAATGLLAYGQP